MFSRVDKLRGFEDANDMPGTLHWEVGYYEKTPLNTALKKDEHVNVPDEIKGTPQAKELEEKEKGQAQGTIADSKEEVDALRTPPDPSIPTGILSVMIHQINNCAYFRPFFRSHRTD